MLPITIRIQELCKLENITIHALEKKLGLSHKSISKWGTSIPSGDRILKVAQYFDVSVDYLLGNTDNPKSHKNEPYYHTAKTVSALLQIKEELSAKTGALSALIDEKIVEAKKLGSEPAPKEQ